MTELKAKLSSSSNFNVKFPDNSQELTLKNTTVTVSRMDRLNDVVTSTANGSILVYDASIDKYIQRDILTYDNEANAFKIEGGDF